MLDIAINKKQIKRNKFLKKNNKINKFKFKTKEKIFLKTEAYKVFDTTNIDYFNLAKSKLNKPYVIETLEDLINMCEENNLVGLSGSKSSLKKKFESLGMYKGEKNFNC